MVVEEIDWRPDHANSISSATGRLVYAGVRSAQVQPTATSKTQIAALLDLLDLHLSEVDCGAAVDQARVTLRIPNLVGEARGALGTLIDAIADGPGVDVLESTAIGWTPTTVGWHPADITEYARWPGLLSAERAVPDLVVEIVKRTAAPELRAYPMLSSQAGWSLRVEGLEVGQATADRVVLKVGRDGKTGNQSLQRRAWIAATGHDSPLTTDSASTAANLIYSFAQQWRSLALTSVDQNEHALESRILRGETPVAVSGRSLSLIQSDSVVNWGSQFPTKWGPGGKARYLDALLRDGMTPWAIEMKVRGGAGVGQYYRYAVAQAVLYREFIRGASPLHFWFEKQGLRAEDCQAAVVVPEIPAKQTQWRGRIARLCNLFNVAFVEVDPAHARKH